MAPPFLHARVLGRHAVTDDGGTGVGDGVDEPKSSGSGVTHGASSNVRKVMDSATERVLPRAATVAHETDADDLVVRLFRAESARLTQMARWFVDDRTAAEDLVQEAFIRLAANAHKIRDPERAAAYLRSIVMNLTRDYNRRGLVSLRHRPPAQPDEGSAEDHAAAREDVREVIEALRGLPRRQRDCVVLRYYLDLSVPDIAETLGLSANSVKTHLQRGLRRLSNDLGGLR
jgi:RNA polymerase sigma-70 factor (sigma-E family)